MLIQTQKTPDENVINFFPDVNVAKEGRADFYDASNYKDSFLATRIFDVEGVKSVFITADMVSVTKDQNANWEDVKAQVMAQIMEYIAVGDESDDSDEGEAKDSDVVKNIKGLLDARIRPAVHQDGGDIIFKSFEDGVVYVEMIGNCNGCPYAMVTLKEGVEKVLKSYIKEVKSVEAVSD